MKAKAETESEKPVLERVLVVEDELAMRTVLQDCLARHGYRVLTAADGELGLARAIEETPDLVLLDLMMPRLDGFAVCRALRQQGFGGRILFLTARGQVGDRVHGLDLGADDYLVKPFSRDELLARVRALLRRRRQDEAPREMVCGSLRIDIPARRVWKARVELELTAKEFAMLQMLVERAGEVIPRETFLDRVWGVTAFPTTRTVDKHIVQLRQKIEDDPANPRHIVTVHGTGYRWEAATTNVAAGV